MIQDLLDERNRIDSSIAKLEALREQRTAAPATAGKRGRKAMSALEREEVSRRMRNYWDRRRHEVMAGEAAREGAGLAELRADGTNPEQEQRRESHSDARENARAAKAGK